MNLVIFIITIIISFLVVRIGAVAFQLTGVEWSLAKFQALSCFSGTGFTTRESELIVSNPQRRRIASFLMIVGNAGLVTLIATFANSLRPHSIKFSGPFLHPALPSYLSSWVNLGIIIVFLYTIYRIFRSRRFTERLTTILRKHIIKRNLIKPVSFEELVVATGGYGILKVEICKNSPVLNKTILEAALRKRDVSILAIERNEEIIPNPSPKKKMLLGDKIICFGKLENIRTELCVNSE